MIIEGKLLVIGLYDSNMDSGNDQANSDQVERLRKELFAMQAQQKKIEDELMMHNIILENVSLIKTTV